jgi:hypothetical protein
VATHYDTLGVARDASPAQVRSAYRERAQRVHPDRHATEPLAAQRIAADRMARLNAAWTVLGDARTRELYDLELRMAERRAAAARAGASAGRAPTGGTSAGGASGPGAARSGPRPRPGPTAEEVDVAPESLAWHAIFRLGPWLATVVVLGAIFVFTAFATPKSSTGQPTNAQPKAMLPVRAEVGDCVAFPSALEMETVPCALPNQGRIVALVAVGRPCPVRTSQAYLPDQRQYACIRAT